jgi:hypothetical protein
MDDDLGTAFVWLAILCGIGVWSSWDSDNIIGRVRHQIAYGVPYAEVHMQARPKDCDFLGAPVGMKDCRYEPLVTAYNSAGEVVPGDKPRYGVDKNTGKTIVSYYDGQSWAWAPAISDQTVKRIYVEWMKVAN